MTPRSDAPADALWLVLHGDDAHRIAAPSPAGAASAYAWTCLASGEVHQVVVERGGARSVWRVERRVQSVCAMEVV